MAGIARLGSEEIERGLEELPHWTIDDDKLFREFVFSDFVDAFAFMTKSAIAIEKVNHHPEWFNVYNKVRVHLTTHEADGISQRDFDLAKTLDALSGDEAQG